MKLVKARLPDGRLVWTGFIRDAYLTDAARSDSGESSRRGRRGRNRRHGIPYQTSVGTIGARIAELVNTKQLDGIRNINDSSAQGQTRLIIELKKDANANVVLNNLWKHTPLQSSFPVNMVALVDGVPRTLNLAQALSPT